jgi:hypothetical protein
MHYLYRSDKENAYYIMLSVIYMVCFLPDSLECSVCVGCEALPHVFSLVALNRLAQHFTASHKDLLFARTASQSCPRVAAMQLHGEA